MTERGDETNNWGGVSLSVALASALDVAQQRGERVFVVGGVVRDLLMSRAIGDHDLDLVVEGEGIPFANCLSAVLRCGVREHQPFLTAKLLAPFGPTPQSGDVVLSEVDVATARKETYERPGALPTVMAAPIEDDLWRRDFSANAIALSLAAYHSYRQGKSTMTDLVQSLTDPCGGFSDIQNSTLRILHPKSFIDDPTRLFRAVRYLVRLSFHFDMATLAGFVEAVKSGALATLSPRRVWNEVLVAFDEHAPCEVLQEFKERGLFGQLPIISVDDPSWVFEALENLEVVRDVVGIEIYREAGKILLIAGLLRDGREDIVRAIHEGNKVIHRARTVLEAGRASQELRLIPDVAAAYCIHASSELRELLEACLREIGG